MKTFTRDLKLLGYIVLYGATREIDHDVDVVNAYLDKSDLGRYRLRKPSKLTAVTRAAKAIERLSVHKITRNIANTPLVKTIAIVHEQIRSSDVIILRQETTGTYIKKTQTFQAKGPDARQFEALYDHYSHAVTGDDFRQLARKIIEDAFCISLRGGEYVKDAGGVYFILKNRIDTMESLRWVLLSLKIGYVNAFGVIDGKSERMELFNTMIAYYRKQIESIDKATAKVTTRIKSLENYKDQLEETKAKMLAYARITNRTRNSQVEEFNSKVLSYKRNINKKIRDIEPQKKKKK